MFTYQEFADQAHYFRQRIKVDPDKELDYEVSRSENEKAVITLSKNSDPATLCNIFSQFSTLMEEIGIEEPFSYERSLKFSALLRYYREIAFKNKIFETELDAIYHHVAENLSPGSGGGLYTLMPDELYSEKLPWFRIKVPITSTEGRNRVIIHEAFVAIVALNPLRQFIPNFSYVYDLWSCGEQLFHIYHMNSFCNIEGSIPSMLYERNAGSFLIYDLFTNYREELDLQFVLSIFLQLAGALHIANLYADYTHYDLHYNNVLLQRLDNPIDMVYHNFSIRHNYRVIIIDNGLAYCKYERPKELAPLRRGSPKFPNSDGLELYLTPDKREHIERLQKTKLENYGSTMNRIIGVRPDRSYPLGDIFRIFFDIYSLCSEKIKVGLKPVVSHFFKDKNPDIFLRGNGRRGSSMVNSFSLPPFREDMYQYRYSDFSDFILETYPRIKYARRRGIVRDLSIHLHLDLFDRNPNFNPTPYDIGILAMIDREKALEFTSKSSLKIEVTASLEKLRDVYRNLLVEYDYSYINEFQERLPTNLEEALEPIFIDPFLDTMFFLNHFTTNALIIYSNLRVLVYAMDTLGFKSPLGIIARVIGVKVQDLYSLTTLCHTIDISEEIYDKVMRMEEYRVVLNRYINKEKRGGKFDHKVITLKTTLQGLKERVVFFEKWYRRETYIGKLSIPPIVKEC